MELPGTEDAVLPPRARLVLVLREGATLSGTELSGFPRRNLLAVSCSRGGDAAFSLIGDTSRDRGRSGDDLRSPRFARPGSAFQCVSFDGDGAILPNANLLAVRGVASNFAISNGLRPVPVEVDRGGNEGPRGSRPGLALGAFCGV
jgi:hypothetical protein